MTSRLPGCRQQARFGRGYRECTALADGSAVFLRRLRRRDAPLIVQVFERLSPEARYQRFFAHKQALSPSDLKALTDCDGDRHLAIVALAAVAGAEQGIGVARFVRLREDPLTAEMALAVVDAHQRKGIGRLLLRRLTEAAAERGIRQRIVIGFIRAMLVARVELEGARGKIGQRPAECPEKVVFLLVLGESKDSADV